MTNSSGEYQFNNLAPALDYYLSTQVLEEGWQNADTLVYLTPLEESALAALIIILVGLGPVIMMNASQRN